MNITFTHSELLAFRMVLYSLAFSQTGRTGQPFLLHRVLCAQFAKRLSKRLLDFRKSYRVSFANMDMIAFAQLYLLDDLTGNPEALSIARSVFAQLDAKYELVKYCDFPSDLKKAS